MTIPLTPELEQFINERVESGQYKSATEVIAGALDALAEWEKLVALRAMLDHADEQLERGEYTEYDEQGLRDLAEDIKTRGRERLAEERKTGVR